VQKAFCSYLMPDRGPFALDNSIFCPWRFVFDFCQFYIQSPPGLYFIPAWFEPRTSILFSIEPVWMVVPVPGMV
jgi:hypothetical protein